MHLCGMSECPIPPSPSSVGSRWNSAGFCDGFGKCEQSCPSGMPIVKQIQAIAQAARERGWDQPSPEELQEMNRKVRKQRLR